MVAFRDIKLNAYFCALQESKIYIPKSLIFPTKTLYTPLSRMTPARTIAEV